MVTSRTRSLIASVCSVLALTIAVASCSRNDGRTLRPPTAGQTDTVRPSSTTAVVDDGQPPLTLTAPWGSGDPNVSDPIADRYTCDGLDVSPPLAWSGGPADVASYAIVMSDLDAVEYTHWVVANIPADQASLPEDYSDPLAVIAENSRGETGYAGPCPPTGSTHRYVLTIHALSQVLEAQSGDPGPSLISAIEAATLETAPFYFTYTR